MSIHVKLKHTISNIKLVNIETPLWLQCRVIVSLLKHTGWDHTSVFGIYWLWACLIAYRVPVKTYVVNWYRLIKSLFNSLLGPHWNIQAGWDHTWVFGKYRLWACLIANCVLVETKGMSSYLSIWYWSIKSLLDTGCPNKHGNSVTNSI